MPLSKVAVLDLPQAAAVLGVPRGTARHLLFDAGFTPHAITGGHWREEDVRALAAAPTDAVLAARALGTGKPAEDPLSGAEVSHASGPQLMTVPQAASALGVHRGAVQALLFESGFTPHSITGGHWRAADVVELRENPTPAVDEARELALRSPDPAAGRRPRARKRAPNVVPDPDEPERLDLVEVASVLGVFGTPVESVIAVLEGAGFDVPAHAPRSWQAAAVHHLASHPTSGLVALRRETQPALVHCSTFNTARLLEIATRSVLPVMSDAGFEQLLATGHWNREDVLGLVDAPTPLLEAERVSARSGPPAPRPTRDDAAAETTRQSPDDPLERAVAHLGPTNSGKTHEALAALAERATQRPAGLVVYAAPLRMMAQEAYAKLARELGDDEVGLITGEERRNVEAGVLCTTTELAPVRGDLLCLDEVQWCADPLRGAAWSQRLLNAEYREMRLVGSPDVLPVLRSVFDERLEVVRHDRLVPLNFIGSMHVDAVLRDPRRTIVIAFRRTAVLSMAAALQRQAGDRKIAVLYGAMPLGARRHQMQRVRDGEVDLVVSSDVLGHGVNLPCDRILFAETAKFDGRQRRPLHNYEIAQIAGRAGRYGFSDVGDVGVLEGLDYFAPDPTIIGSGLKTPLEIEGFGAFRRVEALVDGPQIGDLKCEAAEQLPRALHNWYARARLMPRPGVEFEHPRVMLGRLQFVEEVLRQRGSGLHALTLADAWRLARCRLTITNPADCAVLSEVVAALDDDLPLQTPHVDDFVAIQDLEALEHAARYVESLRWCALAFDQLRLDPGALAACEEIIAEQFAGFFVRLAEFEHRRCERCSRRCSPVSRYCERCVERTRRRRREALHRRTVGESSQR